MNPSTVKRRMGFLWSVAILAAFASAIHGEIPNAIPPNAIPEHPRELVFEERPIAFPNAAGRRHELASGLTMLIVPDASLPLVDLTLALPVGGGLDPPRQAGLAYLTAALMRRGGAGKLAPEAFDERVEALALELDTFGRVGRSGVVLSAPSWNLDQALELFCSLVAEPHFDLQRLDGVEAQLSALMPHRLDDPVAAAEREWTRLIFGNESPRSRDLTPASLENIRRQDLIAFHRRYWRPAEMVLAVSGDIEPRAFLDLWHQRCGELSQVRAPATDSLESARSEPARSDPARPAPAPRPARPGLYHLERDVPQTKILFGHRLPAVAWNSPDRAGLLLLGEILGGGGSIARLGGRLRSAEGLTYEVSSWIDLEADQGGTFRTSFATANHSAGRALALAIEEIRRLRQEPVLKVEIRTARSEVLEPLRRAFDSAESIAGHLAEDELLQRPTALRERLPRALAESSLADVQRLARHYLRPDQSIIVIVGPWREIRKGAKADGIDLKHLTSAIVHLPERDPMTLDGR